MCGGFYLSMTREEKYMKLALKEAKKALLIDEVPIGCVIVKDEKVIARSFNTREKDKLRIPIVEEYMRKRKCL